MRRSALYKSLDVSQEEQMNCSDPARDRDKSRRRPKRLDVEYTHAVSTLLIGRLTGVREAP